MREIVDIARWAPSWVNYQIARYTLVDDEEIIKEIARCMELMDSYTI